ncbi:hypothetical protein DY000_02060722 [Brassica cretica]|uniref:DUF1985 domain-containing protein n=1 Tax=Brassica cretica TaxID=69181 RepID=A0ABQ7AYK9_BRACR|nr:hypothetical protein DY000_02060722 [Brassica cretica]
MKTLPSRISFAKLRRRSVTAWDHIFSDHIFSDNIFSDCLKMDLPELPPRMFTLGEEPAAIRSISYHSDDTKLFKALCDCLTADEYEDLKASKLGVFIKFKELGFGWTSRLVHFILCFQLDIKKKFELWSLVVSQPVRFSLIEFEHLTGLNCDYIKDLENPRCEVTKEMAAFWEKMGSSLLTSWKSSASLKMDLPELPLRMFTLGEEPAAIRSISYHSDDTKLFKALCDCLTAGEYEDLKASKWGVFIKFKELGFGWTSRLFEHLTGLNCDYIKDLENPRCEVKKDMSAFWEKMGVDLDIGPSIEQITEAFHRCDELFREDRKQLGYLAIYAGYIEGKNFSTATPTSLARLVMDLEKFENCPWGRVAFKVLMDSLKVKDLKQIGYTVDGFIQVLQVWAYYAMPELNANYGSPVPDRPSPLLLVYKGGQGRRKYFKSAINRQINVNNFVQKDLDEMFPEWDGDVEDPAADNIIKVIFNDPGWKWTMD